MERAWAAGVTRQRSSTGSDEPRSRGGEELRGVGAEGHATLSPSDASLSTKRCRPWRVEEQGSQDGEGPRSSRTQRPKSPARKELRGLGSEGLRGSGAVGLRCRRLRLSSMGPRLLVPLAFLVLARPAGAAQSTLKIGTCGAGRPPYVTLDASTNQLSGFEVELWRKVWGRMRDDPNTRADPFLRAMVGDSEPELLRFRNEDLSPGLVNGSIDVAFCAIKQNAEDTLAATRYDYAPVHLVTGIQGLINRQTGSTSVNFMALLKEIFHSFNDVYAQTALLLLLYCAIVFAHFFWMLEGKENGMFEEAYGPGIIDSIWFVLVTALTVGYGDKVTQTTSGKLLALVWMVLGAFILGIFTAALTSAFVVSRLAPTGEVTLEQIQDMAQYNVGVSGRDVEAEIVSSVAGVHTRLFASESEMLQELVDGTLPEGSQLDVVVIDARRARFLSQRDDKYKELVLQVGPVFREIGVAFAISRPSLHPHHSVYHLMRTATVDVINGPDRAEYDALVDRYFGDNTLSDAETGMDRLEEALTMSNTIATIVLVGLGLIWSLAVLIHYRAEIQEALVRQKFSRAMGLGKRFSVHDLRIQAGILFDKNDKDASGSLDKDEILGLLKTLGKDVGLEDIMEYVDRELEERELETKREAGSSPAQDDGENRGSGITSMFATKRRTINNITKEEFVRIVEGLIMDQEEIDDDADDLRQPALRRHILTTAADIQTQVHELQTRMDREVKEIKDHVTTVTDRLDRILAAVQSSKR